MTSEDLKVGDFVYEKNILSNKSPFSPSKWIIVEIDNDHVILKKETTSEFPRRYFDKNFKKLNIEYKGYIIIEDWRDPFAKKPEYMFFKTSEGIQHDGDYDEGWKYTGNCRWADSIEDAQGEIDELVGIEQG